MKGLCGYGRHDDNPDHVTCPRTFAATTHCVAREGRLALTAEGVCLGCSQAPGVLLSELDRAADGVTIVHCGKRSDRLLLIADAVQRRVRQVTQRLVEKR